DRRKARADVPHSQAVSARGSEGRDQPGTLLRRARRHSDADRLGRARADLQGADEPARASTAWSSTLTAGTVVSRSMSSFSLWLMPRRQGVKSIVVGHTFVM